MCEICREQMESRRGLVLAVRNEYHGHDRTIGLIDVCDKCRDAILGGPPPPAYAFDVHSSRLSDLLRATARAALGAPVVTGFLVKPSRFRVVWRRVGIGVGLGMCLVITCFAWGLVICAIAQRAGWMK